MWKKFFSVGKSKDEAIVTAVVDQTSALFTQLQNKLDLRFNELSAQLREVEHGLAQMETKLLTKDLKDKQAYGLLHYKLHQAKSSKLSEEISDLETSLLAAKSNSKDQ
ncbi:MAG TPA: hypothetical protein VNJ01_04330 [Bacteriovoracaceae bacterium]|nr:hypothetical protein [Bacteriovoracaceae bacterium]